MNFHWAQALRALILLLFSAFIFMLHHTGEIVRFINPEYVLFSQIASVLFLFLFFIQVPRIWRDRSIEVVDHSNCGPWGCNHEDGYSQSLSIKTLLSYAIIIIPLLTGFLLPGKELDATIAMKRGVYLPGTMQEELDPSSCEDTHFHSQLSHTSTSDEQELLHSTAIILDSTRFTSHLNIITKNPTLFKGKTVQLEGFALRDETLGENYWVIARFLVTHCVADASVIGILVHLDHTDLEENAWIRVQGKLDVISHNHHGSVPIISDAKWQLIRKPKDPYVYPSK
ncbi:TIGR03943 family protein [Anaerobacillus alkaliphilus]|uniref:TIGR03943 family protein n=1 Tax=Anaerobacillus alkaliphilus TaxID=1548597 RepID=A0A4Q0VXA9_9BACI|nr:TIGR03943 family protein [Anaerobacillus alkaliphilus]RXJ04022.1 TIGR03943 family protein [Anaerobacillus alkaliphilus]